MGTSTTSATTLTTPAVLGLGIGEGLASSKPSLGEGDGVAPFELLGVGDGLLVGVGEGLGSLLLLGVGDVLFVGVGLVLDEGVTLGVGVTDGVGDVLGLSLIQGLEIGRGRVVPSVNKEVR